MAGLYVSGALLVCARSFALYLTIVGLDLIPFIVAHLAIVVAIDAIVAVEIDVVVGKGWDD